MLIGLTMHTFQRVAGLAAAFLLFATFSAPAYAHAQLIEVTPEMGSSLDASPPEARLVFNEDLMDFGYAVVVTQLLDGADFAEAQPEDAWISGEPVLDGPAISIPLKPELPPGQYRVAWRVVSADGHPISGVVDFAVGQPYSAESLPNPAESAPANSDDEPGAAGTAANSGGAAGAEDGSALRILLIAIGGGAAALAVWLGVNAARRGVSKRNEKTDS